MKRNLIVATMLILYTGVTSGQIDKNISAKDAYLAEQRVLGNSFSNFFYPNFSKIHLLTEKAFVQKIDSVRNLFELLLQKFANQLDAEFVNNQELEINYYFDKILLDYPNNHDTYYQSDKKTSLSRTILKRLKANLKDFNRPELLSNADFKEYVRAYIYHLTSKELLVHNDKYADNKMLNIAWKLIPSIISNNVCRELWQSEYLFGHIENNGIRNIETILNEFRLSCSNDSLLKRINNISSQDSMGRQGHITAVYKSVNGVTLELHIFLPDSTQFKGKRPVYVYFHGGSWSEGKPDWGFSACEDYSKNGWVGVAVEYRTASRHNSLPFESVMDARSSIRWLRKHAGLYNIDTARIVATGNSAGGHLVLSTALAGKWNERTDDLRNSATPNVLLVNAGVYDLTIDNTKWITKNLKNKDLVKEISPNHLEKKNMPPLLMIHGTNDRNCPYPTAKQFSDELEKTNSNFEFYPLEGVGHFIWYDQKFTAQISKWRKDFLLKLGYE